MDPSIPGSRLDADHPEKGVLFARRFTIFADLVELALAAGTHRRLRRADVPGRLLARLCAHAGWLVIVGRWRRRHPGLEIIELKCQLFVGYGNEPLGPRAKDHVLESLHHRAQLLVLRVEREHHLGQHSRIGWESVEANRHNQTIHVFA